MEPYQIEDPCPISTSPITAALGATKTSLWILGSFSNMFMIVRCLDTDKGIQNGNMLVRLKHEVYVHLLNSLAHGYSKMTYQDIIPKKKKAHPF